jgi:hypothetical protein
MEMNDLLFENGQTLINDIRNNMSTAGQNATGETANSLRIEIKQEGLKYKFSLYGRAFFNTVQTGRRPTPNKKPSREMINRITAWVNARGIDITAVWAIATKIQQEGTKLWQSGGRSDIIDPAIDAFVNNTTNKILENEAEEFKIRINKMEW